MGQGIATASWTASGMDIPYTVYTAPYDVVFDAQEQENQIYTKIKNLWGVTLPKLLLAESDEEFDQIMEDFKKAERGYWI